ncbi:MAG: hypothetical protein ACKOBC_09190 [Hyphomicrobiales bacterium]
MIDDSLDSILLREWDPIDIADTSAARDEYKIYTKIIKSLLVRRVQKVEIAQTLFDIERNEMGLAGDFQRALRVAERLLKLRT